MSLRERALSELRERAREALLNLGVPSKDIKDAGGEVEVEGLLFVWDKSKEHLLVRKKGDDCFYFEGGWPVRDLEDIGAFLVRHKDDPS